MASSTCWNHIKKNFMISWRVIPTYCGATTSPRRIKNYYAIWIISCVMFLTTRGIKMEIRVSDMIDSLYECYSRNPSANLTTAFVNLVPDKTKIPNFNIEKWVIRKYVGSYKFYLRAVLNPKDFRKLSARRVVATTVAAKFISVDDRNVDSIVMSFLANPTTITPRTIFQFLISMLFYIKNTHGDLTIYKY